jgi:hemolysin activation/secretion protein
MLLVLFALFVTPKEARAQAAPAADPTFDVLEYRVEGNSVLSQLAIERSVYPFLGEKKRIADVEAARAALEKAYHDAGYATVIVDVPVQKVREGSVLLKVTEGKVERVTVHGTRYYAQGNILERAPSVAEGEVPFFPQVRGELDQLNRGADRRITPVLRPGTAPGTTEVELKVEDKLPLHGSAELNNRYSPNTTHARLSAGLRYDNMFDRDHSFSVQAQVSPRDTSEVRALVTTYSIPLSDGAFYGYWVASNSNVAAVSDVTVLGKGQIYGLRRNWTLTGSGSFSHAVTAGVDYKQFDENVTQPGTPGLKTPIHYLPFSLDYSGSVQQPSSTTQYSLATIFSLRNIGNNPQDFENKRFKAEPNFAILRWDLQHTQNLPAGFTAAARIDGQATDQPLISNEQFFAGGLMSVRGYLESEVLGDEGVHGSLELRSPALGGGTRLDTRALVFAEGAQVWLRDPLPEQNSRFTISSFGAGLRAKALQTLELWLNVAWPLKSTTYTVAHHPRVQFQLIGRF